MEKYRMIVLITMTLIVTAFGVGFQSGKRVRPLPNRPWHTAKLPTIMQWQSMLNGLGAELVEDGMLTWNGNGKTEQAWKKLAEPHYLTIDGTDVTP